MMMVILWSLDEVPSNRVSPFAIYRPEVSVFYLLMFYAKTVFIRWCHQTEDTIHQPVFHVTEFIASMRIYTL